VEYQLPEALKRLGVNQEHVFLKPQMNLSVFKDAIAQLMGSHC
jgi:hypothetical protein